MKQGKLIYKADIDGNLTAGLKIHLPCKNNVSKLLFYK